MCANLSEENKEHFILSTVSSSVGVLSSLVAIILLLVSKGYKEFIHRLFLYLSTAALLLSVAQLLVVSEEEYSISMKTIRVTTFVIAYMSLIYFSLLSWIGFYVFWLTVFKVQLKKIKHEVIGLGIVLVIPLTFSWLTLYQVHTCFNPKIQLIMVCSVFAPLLTLTLFTSVETGVVLVILCRGARSTASAFQEPYRRAVKEAIPVVVFVTVHQCLITLLLVYQVYSRVMTISGRKPSLTFREIHCSYPLIAMLIPLFLLAQSQLRQKIKFNCCATLLKAQRENSKEQIYTEQDPLLTKT